MKGIKATSLKMWRFYRQMTQKELHLRTGIHQPDISAIENGLMKATPDQQRRICDALKIKPDEIEFWVVTDYDDDEPAQANK